MIEEIVTDLFRIQVPLPESPLKYLNSYVMRSGKDALIVDTGLNRDECYDALTGGLKELGVKLEDARFFITHLHADHFGLVSRLASEPGRVYFSRPETEVIESFEGWEPMIVYAALNGFPEEQLREALNNHPGFKYASKWIPELKAIDDGYVIEFGRFQLECIATPGHTSGHFCLYEAGEKILIAGDHILGDITPNIQCWRDGESPLHWYLDSLDRTAGMDLKLVLPGHRRLITDPYGRIRELKTHHRHRLDETLEIARRAPVTAFDCAAQMSWDLRGTWEDFPLAQKWFATAEATAHLRYLEDDGKLGRETIDDKIHYVGGE